MRETYFPSAKYQFTRLGPCFTLFQFFLSNVLVFPRKPPKVPQIQTEIHPGSQNAVATGLLP